MGLFDKVVKKECVESLPAKCTVTGGNFDILIERRNGKLMMLEGKKSDVEASYTTRISNSADKKSGMKSITVDGGLFTEKTYATMVADHSNVLIVVIVAKCPEPFNRSTYMIPNTRNHLLMAISRTIQVINLIIPAINRITLEISSFINSDFFQTCIKGFWNNLYCKYNQTRK